MCGTGVFARDSRTGMRVPQSWTFGFNAGADWLVSKMWLRLGLSARLQPNSASNELLITGSAGARPLLPEGQGCFLNCWFRNSMASFMGQFQQFHQAAIELVLARDYQHV